MKKTQIFKIIGYIGFGLLILFLLIFGAILAWDNKNRSISNKSISQIQYESVITSKGISDFLMEKSFADSEKRESSRIYLYSQGLSFIEEIRDVKFKKGKNLLSIQDIPRGIIPDTIFVKPIESNKFYITRQVFKNDLPGENNFLNSLLGEEVSLINMSSGTKDVTYGKLLGVNNGYVIESKNGLDVLFDPNQISFENIPQGTYSYNPIVLLDVNAEESGSYGFRTSYLTNDFSWSASYIAELDGENLNLTGWANIINNSKISYPKAKITLVSGEPNVNTNNPTLKVMESEPTQNFEYQLYSLKDPLDIDKSNSQRLAFMYKPNIKTSKMYIYEGGFKEKKPLSVKLKIKNDKENGLGMSIPKGIIRFYSETSEGSLFIGEANIDQFNVGDEKELFIGQAMDVIGQKIIKERQLKPKIISLGKQCVIEKIEITITNKSNGKKDVMIRDYLQGTEAIIKNINIEKYSRIDSNTIEIPITVEASKDFSLSYELEYCYEFFK